MMHFLQSKATDENDYFHQSLLCIAEQNENGSTGFIINRPFLRKLNELQEFAHLPAFPLYEGGPVNVEHLYFLHRRPGIIEDGKPISNGIYLGGNFKQATVAIAKGMLHQNDIRIFIGYCGWDAGELENEMREGDWEMTDADIFL